MEALLDSLNTIYLLIIIGIQLVIVLILSVLIIRRRKQRIPTPVAPLSVEPAERLLFKTSAKLHIGQRSNQQDAIEVMDPYKQKLSVDFMAVLCDGMGGIEKGEEASRYAVSQMKRLAYEPLTLPEIPSALKSAARSISSGIYQQSLQGAVPGGMGTTLVTVMIRDGLLHWASVGDSKLYLYRYNTLAQVNQQHNYLYTLLEEVGEGSLSREEALSHEDAEKLISYLGQQEVKLIDVNETPLILQHKDVLLLCSDGVFGTISDREIEEVLELTHIEAVASEIIKRVLRVNKAHQDNMSVIAIEYLGS